MDRKQSGLRIGRSGRAAEMPLFSRVDQDCFAICAQHNERLWEEANPSECSIVDWRVESEEGCVQRRGISARTGAGIRQFLSLKLHGARACPHVVF